MCGFLRVKFFSWHSVEIYVWTDWMPSSLHHITTSAALQLSCVVVQYLMELTLVDGERFLRYLPSTVAACCTYISLHTLGFDNCVSTCLQVMHGRLSFCSDGWNYSILDTIPQKTSVGNCSKFYRLDVLSHPANAVSALKGNWSTDANQFCYTI